MSLKEEDLILKCKVAPLVKVSVIVNTRVILSIIGFPQLNQGLPCLSPQSQLDTGLPCLSPQSQLDTGLPCLSPRSQPDKGIPHRFPQLQLDVGLLCLSLARPTCIPSSMARRHGPASPDTPLPLVESEPQQLQNVLQGKVNCIQTCTCSLHE